MAEPSPTPLGSLGFKIYVLILLLLAYLLNQLDRYMLSIVTKPMAQDLHYGTKACAANSTTGLFYDTKLACSNISTETSCHERGDCSWDYDGQGFAFEILAGPIFIVVYTLAGIPLSFWADVYNRKKLLGASLLFWSIMTLLTGFVKTYWQLAIVRFGLGIGEAGCTPFATSLIADYFHAEHRAMAIGVYNWGIYMGYSLSYAVGNFITKENILGMGWRWTYFISGAPGLILGPLIFFTIREPERLIKTHTDDASSTDPLLGDRKNEKVCCQKTKAICRGFCAPSILLLCLGGSIRNGAGYVWAYNTQPYFESSLLESPENIAKYMSWIPLVGGSIGVVLGGFISDRVVKRVGPHARLLVLIASQILAAPFVGLALYLSAPWCYLILIPGYIFGEMWVGIVLAVLVELVPTSLRTVGVAVYLFIISNIGGNMTLLVPPLQLAFENAHVNPMKALQYALYILYPGMYLLGAVFFILSLIILKRDLNLVRRLDYEQLS